MLIAPDSSGALTLGTNSDAKERLKNNFAVSSAIITAERVGYFEYAEVIFEQFRSLRLNKCPESGGPGEQLQGA